MPSAYAQRLTHILIDLGYTLGDGRLALRRAARAIARRSGRPFEESRLIRLVHKGGIFTLDDAVTLSLGLGIDIRELAFEEGYIPKSGRRPLNPLEDLEVL